MFNMDLNCKGIAWVGSIYQKFETMCQEVEDIVCQDTLKYVESQVQTVGENVKKFYVEVVQDLLPSESMDPSEQADSDLSLEKNADVGIGKQSMVVVEKDALKENPSMPKEPKLIASVQKYSVAHSASQLLPPSSVKPVKENLSLEQDRFSMHKLSRVGNGEDKREKKTGTKSSLIGRRVQKEPKLFASVQKNSSGVTHSPSSVKPVKAEGLDSSLGLGTVAMCKIAKAGSGEDSKKEKQAYVKASSFSSTHRAGHLITPCSVDPTKEAGADLYVEEYIKSGMPSRSGLKIGENTLNEKSALVDAAEVISPVRENSSGRSLLCIHSQNGDELTKSAPLSQVEVAFNTVLRAGSIHSSVLSETLDIPNARTSSDLVFPVVLHENKTLKIGQSVTANSLSKESNVSLMGALKDGLEERKICGTESGNFITPSESGRSDDDRDELEWGNDAVEQRIEIIGPDENVRLGESCIVVDRKEFHFTSPREGKHRSYKKKLRDAFALRKGLAKKDYEQLAIWCEDIDARTNQKRADTSALSTLHDSCEESEWEFL